MKTVFAFFAVLFCFGSSFAVDSLSVSDTTIARSQIIIPAHIDSVLPAFKTVYVPATYNRNTAFICNAWSPDSSKMKQFYKFNLKKFGVSSPRREKICVRD